MNSTWIKWKSIIEQRTLNHLWLSEPDNTINHIFQHGEYQHWVGLGYYSIQFLRLITNSICSLINHIHPVLDDEPKPIKATFNPHLFNVIIQQQTCKKKIIFKFRGIRSFSRLFNHKYLLQLKIINFYQTTHSNYNKL